MVNVTANEIVTAALSISFKSLNERENIKKQNSTAQSAIVAIVSEIVYIKLTPSLHILGMPAERCGLFSC